MHNRHVVALHWQGAFEENSLAASVEHLRVQRFIQMEQAHS